MRHWVANAALRGEHNPAPVAVRTGRSSETLLQVYAQEIEQGESGVAASLAG